MAEESVAGKSHAFVSGDAASAGCGSLGSVRAPPMARRRALCNNRDRLGVALNGPEMPDVRSSVLTGELVEPDPVSTGVGSR
jgi:hypothetical protein